MKILRRVLAVAGVGVAAAIALAIVFVVVLKPEVDEPCAPGFEACLAAADGWVDEADCRIELYHCRRSGPEHWEEEHGPVP